MNNIASERLKLYVVSCHVDKPIEGSITESKYNIGIQAGAAATSLRTQEISDLDYLEDNISDRNERYSEATAMYWIYRNISSKYVGITHYRRRFRATDEQLDELMDKGVDIITLPSVDLGKSVREDYIEVQFKADWALFFEILESRSPDMVDFAKEYFEGNLIHPCNLNIFKGELYKEYGDWAFPIMDEFYKRSPRKRDRYQRRDVGFIAERLSSLYVEKKRLDGYMIVELPLDEIDSKHWNPYDECNMDDAEDVFEACVRLYSMDKITETKNVIGKAINHEAAKSQKIVLLSQMLITAEYERLNNKVTMYEYLPADLSKDLGQLLETYSMLVSIVCAINNNGSADNLKLFSDFISVTHFSGVAIFRICEDYGLDRDKIVRIISGDN